MVQRLYLVCVAIGLVVSNEVQRVAMSSIGFPGRVSSKSRPQMRSVKRKLRSIASPLMSVFSRVLKYLWKSANQVARSWISRCFSLGVVSFELIRSQRLVPGM